MLGRNNNLQRFIDATKACIQAQAEQHTHPHSEEVRSTVSKDGPLAP